MPARQRDLFLTVKTEGVLLPADLLQRIIESDSELGGLTPETYHLGGGEKLTEATSRSWNRLLGIWSNFHTARGKLSGTDPGIKITREQWLLPLFQELGYGRLLSAKAIEIDGKSYPISHGWNCTPIHLLGCRVDLDRPTPGLAGASRTSPHGLLQELLNRSSNHRWGFVSNGLQFRILRDNASLTRQAYVEFDLEAMMQGEIYSDFVLLWLLCHESRVEAERPEECWLEKWSQASKERGVRALDQLQAGVETAIKALGRGFLAWSGNSNLRDCLRRGELVAQDYYRQVLRLVYRLLFLFAAEDRSLLLLPGEAHSTARERYLRYYSTIRLRRLAERRTGTRHADLYTSLRLVMAKLASDTGCPELALPPLGSFLFSDRALPDIEAYEISNYDLLEAVRALATTTVNGVVRPVDYKNLGAEELGSVYESLLELHPRLDLDAAVFDLGVAAGHERKKTGSYYTPASLVECLLDSALNPVLDQASKKEEPEAAILKLKVVDPACGSGHFLIAAAHRIAKRLALVRTGDEEPSPEAIKTALRDVIGHCIYGVDVNPMAVELCKVNLWLEALEPGKPLSFLEHHIQVGNSLLGTTPRLLEGGIPDEAFQSIEGDLREACTKWRKVNKNERKVREVGAGKFAFEDYPWLKLGNFAQSLIKLDNLGDSTIEGVRTKAKLWEEAVRSSDYLDGKLLADTWCATFVWKKDSLLEPPITEDVFRQIERNPQAVFSHKSGTVPEIQRLAGEYNFFHWHLAFPDVFHVPGKGKFPENEQAGWSGGFDLVLGNPPWERVKLQEKEWFALKSVEVMNAPNAAARKKAIARIKAEFPDLYTQFRAAAREAEAESHLLRNGSRFPLCAQGDLNTYSLFAELFTQIVNKTGFAGIIVPTGIATDDSNSDFFGHLIERKRLKSLFDFENRERVLFPEVYYRMRFCLLTVCGPGRVWEMPTFRFFALRVQDLTKPGQIFSLSANDIEFINPNTKTCPIFRSQRDVEIVKRIYSKVPILLRESTDRHAENSWQITFARSFHMTNDAELFTSEEFFNSIWQQNGNIFERPGEEYWPLYEGRMINNYDHRLASTKLKDIKLQRSGESITLTSEQKADPACIARPRYWISAEQVKNASQRMFEQRWVVGCMSITSATNARTCVTSIIPKAGIGNSILGLLVTADARYQCCLLANFCSLPFDYVCKQKVSGNNFNMFIIKQLPVLPPDAFDKISPWNNHLTLLEWILPRAVELSYTANDLRKFAQDAGYDGEPFRWDDQRRFLLRCELDAAFLHLFGLDRNAATHVLDAFTIIRSREEEEFAEYRTKHVILEIHDAMNEAERTGTPYQTRLNPPPADPSCCCSSEEFKYADTI